MGYQNVSKEWINSGFGVVVFNATFNNISVISLPSVLSVDETGCKSEFTPSGYTVIARRDRQDGYGGVFIMAKSNTPCDELYSQAPKQSELVAIYVVRSNNQPLMVGLNRPPK